MNSSNKRQYPAGAPPSRPPPSLPAQGPGHRNMPLPKRPPPSAPQSTRPLSPGAPKATALSKPAVATPIGAGAAGQESIQKKSTMELIKVLNANEDQMKLMEKFLGSLSTNIKSQLEKANAHNREALELGKVIQGFSIEFLNGDSNSHLTELGHCTVAVGNLIQAVYGAFDYDLVIII